MVLGDVIISSQLWANGPDTGTCLNVAILAGDVELRRGMQAATDEYIAQNEERFLEAADLLLQGIEDPSADAARAPTSLSLGK